MKYKLIEHYEESNNQAYDYRLPKLTYNEWEQALSTVSIIAFMQGMPIGLKYYNNYVVVSSTLNGEWVDPQELYFTSEDDEYYHQRSCNDMKEEGSYVGYRATDYVRKTYLSLSIDAEGNLIKKDITPVSTLKAYAISSNYKGNVMSIIPANKSR
mgnify:CR=1 FL=1